MICKYFSAQFQANLNCISVSTPKDLVEMDITGILNPPVWLEDETEYDIEIIKSLVYLCVLCVNFRVKCEPLKAALANYLKP